MAISSFEVLCSGLCEVAGLEVPDLTSTDGGDVAIEVELRGVRIVISHGQGTGPNQAFVAATFGFLPEGRGAEAARTLLKINCKVLPMGLAFARNPVTGEIVLKQAYAFHKATAVDLYQRILKMVEGIEGWREHFFLAEA